MISKDLEKKIIERLPYESSFKFVDNILDVNEDEITGTYTYTKENCFYKGHFKNNPVTPGIILVETMGQIGIVSHIIYLLKLYETNQHFYPLLINVQSDFFKRVYIEEIMKVHAKKVYYRKNLLRSNVEMINPKGEVVARSTGLLKFIFDNNK
jgi:3-hydroxyacyl-[acyl-carrier-protein] dehydratase